MLDKTQILHIKVFPRSELQLMSLNNVYSILFGGSCTVQSHAAIAGSEHLGLQQNESYDKISQAEQSHQLIVDFLDTLRSL